MDWKEMAKWVGVIAIGGAVATVFEIIITNKIHAEATAAARTEVDRVISAAVQQIQTARAPQLSSPQTSRLNITGLPEII